MAQPRTRRAGIEALAAIVALGLVVFTSPDGFPVAILGMVLLGVTSLMVSLHRDPEVRSFLSSLLFWALALRLLVFMAVRLTVGPYVFAPDASDYEVLGMGLRNYLAGEAPIPGKLAGSLQVGFYAINAALYAVFGYVRELPALLNAFLMTWIAVPGFHLARLLVRGHMGVARWMAGLCALFPSLILWSVLNIREAPTALVLTLAVLAVARIQHGGSIWDIAWAVLLLGVLATFREYLAVLVGLAAPLGILVGRSRRPTGSFAASAVILLVVLFALDSLGLGGSLTSEPTLSQLEYLRRDMAQGAGSAYGQGFDVSTPGGALVFLPVGVIYFLFAPFPWNLGSVLQVISLPEILLWYALVPFTIRGLWLGLRHDARSFASLLVILGTVLMGYAMVEGNVGTAFRHRAQILPLIFVFTALGLADAVAVWRARREARASTAKTARRRGVRRPDIIAGR